MNNLKIKRKDAVALVIVDRPEKLNALNRETIEELSEALAALEGGSAGAGTDPYRKREQGVCGWCRHFGILLFFTRAR